MRNLEILLSEFFFLGDPVKFLARNMPEPSQNVDQLPPENQHLSPNSQSTIPVRMPLHGVIIRQPGNEVYGKFEFIFTISFLNCKVQSS